MEEPRSRRGGGSVSGNFLLEDIIKFLCSEDVVEDGCWVELHRRLSCRRPGLLEGGVFRDSLRNTLVHEETDKRPHLTRH